MKGEESKFIIRDTIDCNFFVIQLRQFPKATVNIFYDTLNDKFVHNTFDKPDPDIFAKLKESGIDISDLDQP
jgi:hypothetical protein